MNTQTVTDTAEIITRNVWVKITIGGLMALASVFLPFAMWTGTYVADQFSKDLGALSRTNSNLGNEISALRDAINDRRIFGAEIDGRVRSLEAVERQGKRYTSEEAEANAISQRIVDGRQDSRIDKIENKVFGVN